MLKLQRHRSQFAYLVLSACALVTFAALADEVLDSVVVVGQRIGGGALTCMSGPCLDTSKEQAAQALREYQQMYQTFPEEELPLDASKFCRALSAKQPSGCSLASPPASPGIVVPGERPYAPNGCGTGWSDRTAAAIFLRAYSADFSGDVDAPYPGVSFLGACNAHDTCWAAGRPRGDCDLSFGTAVRNACRVLGQTETRSSCEGLAGVYYSAVSNSRFADANYATALRNRQCATWARDMRENGCAR